jgi:lambda repressor-like predicted transcriptional regulator
MNKAIRELTRTAGLGSVKLNSVIKRAIPEHKIILYF